jgi:hypothetical protein
MRNSHGVPPVNQFRIFNGDQSEDANSMRHMMEQLEEPEVASQRVSVSCGEVFELLQDAISTNRAWLQDFADDTIDVPQDLYEVLVAYKRLVYRRAA